MIKDRNLKLKLVKYFIDQFWYPQLEVDILSRQRLSNTRKLVTDIDVLGLYTNVNGSFESVLGDCKTLKNQSPISRTMWMRGLMSYVNASQGFIILSKEIEKEHQLTSSQLCVQLLSEKDFDIYSRATTDKSVTINSALADGTAWDQISDIGQKFPALKDILEFGKSGFWNIQNSNDRLRQALTVLRSNRREFDPNNKLHHFVVLNHFSLIAITINDVVNQIFQRYLIPENRNELDHDLKIMIWGGIENYEYLNELRKRFANQNGEEGDLVLPNWPEFIELIRTTLESPRALGFLPLLTKELAYSLISNVTDVNYAFLISQKNKFVSSFGIRLCRYLVKACLLPPEFDEAFRNQFMNIAPWNER